MSVEKATQSEISIVDKLHFEELAQKDPQEVCRRALCQYEATDRSYRLNVWGDDYRIYPQQQKIECLAAKGQLRQDYFDLFCVHYLLYAKSVDLSAEWISEKDLPGGATFFRGPHEIPTRLITERFGDRCDGFVDTCAQLGGTAIEMADAAYRFEITPRLPIAVLYWESDDDFGAESKILYDRTVGLHLAADIVFALAVGVCQRLSAAP